MALADYSIQKKIQEGNIGEFETLFKKYYEPLCHYAESMLKDIDIAEEVVQEFFYNYWKNRATISIQLSLNAYLYKSIKNNSLNYLRQQNVRKKYATQSIETQKEEETMNPQDEMEMAELNRIVEETLHQLPERCSQIFQMSRFEGKKYQEIADKLAISIKTVEADMGKALSLFREKLKRYNRVAM
jgi:RNA polymerase sigma-70 factor (ECF subfamily)